MDDPFDLQRFTKAQDRVYGNVLAELRAGEKRTHWMWFVFPQVEGLGHSEMARRYAISGLDEARAYLAHPVLGARLRECTRIVAAHTGRTAHDIFGDPDTMKLRSSMTLFAAASPEETVFAECLRRHFGGNADARTVGILEGR